MSGEKRRGFEKREAEHLADYGWFWCSGEWSDIGSLIRDATPEDSTAQLCENQAEGVRRMPRVDYGAHHVQWRDAYESPEKRLKRVTMHGPVWND